MIFGRQFFIIQRYGKKTATYHRVESLTTHKNSTFSLSMHCVVLFFLLSSVTSLITLAEISSFFLHNCLINHTLFNSEFGFLPASSQQTHNNNFSGTCYIITFNVRQLGKTYNFGFFPYIFYPAFNLSTFGVLAYLQIF